MKLRVSLDNLLAAEQVGRWWIVGSSWSGAPMISEQRNTATKQSTAEGQVEYWNHRGYHSCSSVQVYSRHPSAGLHGF